MDYEFRGVFSVYLSCFIIAGNLLAFGKACLEFYLLYVEVFEKQSYFKALIACLIKEYFVVENVLIEDEFVFALEV